MRHEYAPAGMDTGDAEKVGTILQERLASLIDLSLVLKHVHWNVIGPGFIAIHELMDEQTDVTREMVDEAAERISTLGGVAAGLAQQVVATYVPAKISMPSAEPLSWRISGPWTRCMRRWEPGIAKPSSRSLASTVSARTYSSPRPGDSS